jgi:hypothetical protein
VDQVLGKLGGHIAENETSRADLSVAFVDVAPDRFPVWAARVWNDLPRQNGANEGEDWERAWSHLLVHSG